MSLETAISNLVSRLESVAARLEKVESQIASGATAGPAASSGTAGGAGGSDGGSSQSVQEYDALINQYIKPYVEVSGKLDPAVKAQVCLFIYLFPSFGLSLDLCFSLFFFVFPLFLVLLNYI